MMTLEGPEGKAYVWQPSLRHVAALEETYGSLYLLAEHLLDQSLTLTAIVGAVKTLYRQAGCEADLDAFLLRRPCTGILVEALLAVLGPVEGKETAPDTSFLNEMMKTFPDQDRT